MNKEVGKVINLFIAQKGQEERLSMQRIELDDNGILEDKFYAKDKNRSVLLTTIQSYALALEYGIELSYGLLGENILIDYNPYALPIGTRLKIVEVVVEIIQNCTICNHLSKIDPFLPKLLEHDRGIFVKVMESGFIAKGETVTLL